MCCWWDKLPFETRDVHLPHRDSAMDGSAVAAAGSCPKCHSYIWVRVNEQGGDASRECAECGQMYRVTTRPLLEEAR